MRVCPAGPPVKAHAPVPTVRFLTSGFGRRSREVHRGGTRLKPTVAPSGVRGESVNQQEP